MDEVVRMFFDYYPYSIGVALAWVAMLLYFCWQCKRCVCGECDDDDEEEEYYETAMDTKKEE